MAFDSEKLLNHMNSTLYELIEIDGGVVFPNLYIESHGKILTDTENGKEYFLSLEDSFQTMIDGKYRFDIETMEGAIKDLKEKTKAKEGEGVPTSKPADKGVVGKKKVSELFYNTQEDIKEIVGKEKKLDQRKLTDIAGILKNFLIRFEREFKTDDKYPKMNEKIMAFIHNIGLTSEILGLNPTVVNSGKGGPPAPPPYCTNPPPGTNDERCDEHCKVPEDNKKCKEGVYLATSLFYKNEENKEEKTTIGNAGALYESGKISDDTLMMAPGFGYSWLDYKEAYNSGKVPMPPSKLDEAARIAEEAARIAAEEEAARLAEEAARIAAEEEADSTGAMRFLANLAEFEAEEAVLPGVGGSKRTNRSNSNNKRSNSNNKRGNRNKRSNKRSNKRRNRNKRSNRTNKRSNRTNKRSNNKRSNNKRSNRNNKRSNRNNKRSNRNNKRSNRNNKRSNRSNRKR